MAPIGHAVKPLNVIQLLNLLVMNKR